MDETLLKEDVKTPLTLITIGFCLQKLVLLFQEHSEYVH